MEIKNVYQSDTKWIQKKLLEFLFVNRATHFKSNLIVGN